MTINLKRNKNYPESCTDWMCEHIIEIKGEKVIPNAIITTAESGFVEVPICEDCLIEFMKK